MVVGCMFETILLKLFYNQISVLTTVSYSVITIYRGDSIIAALPLYLERMMSMTREDQELLDRINEYADQVLKDFDPQKTRVSFQLEKLKPIMEEIAKEQNKTVEEIFIKYMDLASQVTVSRETKFQNTIGNMTKYGDVHDAF